MRGRLERIVRAHQRFQLLPRRFPSPKKRNLKKTRYIQRLDEYPFLLCLAKLDVRQRIDLAFPSTERGCRRSLFDVRPLQLFSLLKDGQAGVLLRTLPQDSSGHFGLTRTSLLVNERQKILTWALTPELSRPVLGRRMRASVA